MVSSGTEFKHKRAIGNIKDTNFSAVTSEKGLLHMDWIAASAPIVLACRRLPQLYVIENADRHRQTLVNKAALDSSAFHANSFLPLALFSSSTE